MALSVGELKSLARSFDEELGGLRIGHLLQYSGDSFFFRLGKGKRLCFVLDNQDPRVYLASSPLEGTGISTPFGLLLKKYVANAIIDSVSLYGEDRVLCFDVTSINEVFKEEKYRVLAELIPGKANLALLDEKGTVVGGLRTNLITDPRPLFRGVTYEPPLSKTPLTSEDKELELEAYRIRCEEKEETLAEKRKKERFRPLLRSLQTKKKASERKIKAIESDIEAAKAHLSDGDFGDFIYTNYGDIDPKAKTISFDGRSAELDPRCSLSENATRFYKRAKKAKATLEEASKNLEKAKKERDEAVQALYVLEHSTEEGLESFAKEFGLDQKNGSGKGNALGESSLLPFEVKVNGVSYLFGKSARQNDFLTFLLETKKTQLWMHVKDNHGAHLIIKKDNPTNREIEIGAELALLASKLEFGEVMYALRRDVRKGNVPGQAIVREYSSCYIRKVSEEAEEAFLLAEKVRIAG